MSELTFIHKLKGGESTDSNGNLCKNQTGFSQPLMKLSIFYVNTISPLDYSLLVGTLLLNIFVSPALAGKTQGPLCPSLVVVVCCFQNGIDSNFHMLQWISTKIGSWMQHGNQHLLMWSKVTYQGQRSSEVKF